MLFILMGHDKRMARRGGRRISEAALFFLCIIGGSAGGILGMLVFRHKTRHVSFCLGFPLILILQTAVFVWAMR